MSIEIIELLLLLRFFTKRIRYKCQLGGATRTRVDLSIHCNTLTGSGNEAGNLLCLRT